MAKARGKRFGSQANAPELVLFCLRDEYRTAHGKRFASATRRAQAAREAARPSVYSRLLSSICGVSPDAHVEPPM
jgi:hypothetical protein